ncbi:MAG: hypothetical protein NW224_28135 [Leptolyngbyaceae cyanobacterium bins.302]|nr:hypothetical protein [Leptolyngbyaceae cyanobacterium bins.302]
MIILLDLNYTLVSNSLTKKSPFTKQIEGEVYRDWLIELVKLYYTILITARPQKYQEQTLASIASKTGWQPQDNYFNAYNLRPPQAKEKALRDSIFPRYGRDTLYLGIESNPRTRTMYAKHGIQSIFVEANTQWTTLPQLDTNQMANGSLTTL